MNKQIKTETLTFARRAEAAHIVTDGRQVRVYRDSECRAFDTLHHAIAYLAKLDFKIVPDEFFRTN